MDLGLERVTQLLEALAPINQPAPHLAFPIIHVAGTNGKGSICAYLSSILSASGFRVGRYNSPHLITPRDTIQVNNQPVSEEDYQYATELVKQKDALLNLKATSFELLTATAFYWFAYGRSQQQGLEQGQSSQAANKVDIAVIEVGVGGRLDATNVIPRPKVCVIASIGMDHAGLLGNTIQEVAFEKAGIIKPLVPVVIAPQSEAEQVYRVVEEKAANMGLAANQVHKVKAAHWISTPSIPSESTSTTSSPSTGHWASLDNGFEFWIPLLGDFQLENAATAIAAIDVLRETGNEDGTDDADPQWKTRITDETIRKGIKDTVWPGRLQWLEAKDAPSEIQGRMLIDGAHNPAAAMALRSFVDGATAASTSTAMAPLTSSPRKTHWIMGFTKGKDIEEMFDILFVGPHSSQDTFSAVEFSPPEGMPWVSPILSREVCERLTRQQERVYGREEDRLSSVYDFGLDLGAALESVGKQRQDGDVVVLCGSLYLVADLFRMKICRH
ncbi:hypothetical protein BG011_005119 [Mortierella polycephala]|uniref:Mur ligase central domain-containing protein n=1 Tax=Mortierella polycephala TaxID=41804 RepID=A0A9P6PZV7_9FUNG|nr:hypothetical protein BG011_005119 [Mortierella polycephala]